MSHPPPPAQLGPGPLALPSQTTTADLQTSLLWLDAQRKAAFEHWLAAQQAAHGLLPQTLRPASADASFRRYFRLDTQSGGSCIVMDAPPALEDCKPFVQIASLMAAAGLNVPQILNWDAPQGFMLLSDLGTQTVLEAIDQSGPDNSDTHRDYYLQAIDTLLDWQRASRPGVLPPYDAALLQRELDLFPTWYLGEHRKVPQDAALLQKLDTAFQQIIAHNLSAPQVFVHRDFMPRNLMLGHPLGVLDFQDAVFGPITYDIASLLRDAFISWDEDFVLDITVRYWQKARKAGLFQGHVMGDDFGEFYRGIEWMGLQRHLKILGIFARLTLRDGKAKYLADAPRFIQYVRSTCARYRELKPLLRLIDDVEGIAAPVGYAFGRVG
jgi:N-acetylmuramate 1-kinase